jgi:hypothetical protein
LWREKATTKLDAPVEIWNSTELVLFIVRLVRLDIINKIKITRGMRDLFFNQTYENHLLLYRALQRRNDTLFNCTVTTRRLVMRLISYPFYANNNKFKFNIVFTLSIIIWRQKIIIIIIIATIRSWWMLPHEDFYGLLPRRVLNMENYFLPKCL